MIKTEKINIKTKGNTDIINITEKVRNILEKTKSKEGMVNVFVRGTTAALTINEYETNLIKDIKNVFDKLIEKDKEYNHNDGNAHSHLREILLLPNVSIPFKESELLLGTWQQILLIDFDTRPRQREIIVQITGE